MVPTEQRAHPRQEITGRAVWNAGRRECSCALRNVSAGGALIERPDGEVAVGQRLNLTIVLGNGEPLPIPAAVIRVSGGAVAFRFERVTPGLLKALAEVAEAPGA